MRPQYTSFKENIRLTRKRSAVLRLLLCSALLALTISALGITPTISSGFNLTLQLCYTPTESNGLALNALRFWKFSGGAWTSVPGTPVTSTVGINSCATLTGINTLSTWTLATSQPTAVVLQTFSAQPKVPVVFLPLLALIAAGTLVSLRRRRAH